MASVRVILPPKFDEQALDKVLESEFKKYAPFLVKDFDKTTRHWKGDKPTFEPHAKITSTEWRLKIRLAGPKEGRAKWNYLNEGTRPHVIRPKGNYPLRFRTGYQAGSSPGTLFTFAGGATGPEVRAREVHHPGNAAREWSDLIVKDQQKPFERWMQAAMKRAAAASGQEMK